MDEVSDQLTRAHEDLMAMAEVLHAIAQDSPDADIVRLAVGGLQHCPAGLTILELKPLVV